MSNMTQLPPAVVDMINVVRDPSQSPNYRENVAARLATIAEVCEAEHKKFRAERARAEDARRAKAKRATPR